MVRAAWRAVAPRLAVRAALLALLVIPAAIALEAPRLDPLWLSRAAAKMVTQSAAAGCAGRDGGLRRAEPRLPARHRHAHRLARNGGGTLISARGREALVESREDEAFRQALSARGWQAQVVERAAGLDYSNGKRLILTLYRGVPG